MKVLIKILSLFFLVINISQAQEKETFDVIVHVSNFKNNNGQVLVAVFNTKESFLNKSFKSEKVKIVNNQCKVIFYDLPKGVYAISLFHDENSNNKMDTNFLGIPKETYGCSNNARGIMGPPKWDDAKFEITKESVKQNIQL